MQTLMTSLAITDEHQALARTVAEVLEKHETIRAAHHLLEQQTEPLPSFWEAVRQLGWLGLHIEPRYGGSGYGYEELAVVAEQFGRAVAPGPFVPTVIASGVIDAAGGESLRAELLPLLTDGTMTAGIGFSASVRLEGAEICGSAELVLTGGQPDLLVLPVGEDAVVIPVGEGVQVEAPPNIDGGGRSSRVRLEGVDAQMISGGRRLLTDLGRVVLSAETLGVARASTEAASTYASQRIQFGRPIGTFQAVKHHCANMLVETELAAAAVWDAARSVSSGGDQLHVAAAVAASVAAPAAEMCSNLNTQVHGGIAITWDHDAHLYVRRAASLLAYLEPDGAGAEVVALQRRGVVRSKSVELPSEADAVRREVQDFVASVKGLTPEKQRERLIATGYAVPHWPRPYGRDANAVEQLVIEEEFANADLRRPSYGITGWVILTLIQYGTDDQLERWVTPTLDQEMVWCQLFSEPDAGSDAAGIKTRGVRVDGGWRLTGQKVWTSGAHRAQMGLATVRTDPERPKHEGITTMAVDMHAPGVDIRPLRMTTGASEFNEVFFDDVFVADDDVVGPVNGGWTVARATLGNESVSIGGGEGQLTMPASALVRAFEAHPELMGRYELQLGRYSTRQQAVGLLNLRRIHRAVTGGDAGPEGAVTKLALTELGHEAAALLNRLPGPNTVYSGGATAYVSMFLLLNRAMSIAGGTSEIKRNQIAERILGLPRDPLI
jgi:alkylation response protein AidB-like acyl-CoA dehydrogenase